MDYGILLSFMGATMLLALTPGPDNIFVLMQSMVNGFKFGFATIIGLMTGCIVHTTLVAFGVSAIIQANDYLFFGLRLFGALYLLYLAYRVFKSSSEISFSDEQIKKKTTIELFKQGFIMNVLNPKVSIFFLALFPGFLFSDELTEVVQFYTLGFLFIASSFVVFTLIALLAGVISRYIKKNPESGVVLKWLQIVVFVGIAIFILIPDK
ncbi:LysE family translocator [Spongiivirga citrea]|uniref:LysE family transporter n=1 Tax=Spongiivirga citrea TaxID=1481457 RepID=A0A6M0CJD5_9FLAO|nr:LysE family translocator [Spongiivirga citrea]NER16049.1 LysE family transporter [Spongiivirga citrea]